jgi:hypothetical protein
MAITKEELRETWMGSQMDSRRETSRVCGSEQLLVSLLARM